MLINSMIAVIILWILLMRTALQAEKMSFTTKFTLEACGNRVGAYGNRKGQLNKLAFWQRLDKGLS
ncbi:hypothetical protein [Vibrio navarrensis]|uniref:hypothetical protein n=1 Tax=Vibrio navarrensis TaxID=29495 RepID=UPI00186A555A|nr:hypothetical protein [Vibrio navarrensis]